MEAEGILTVLAEVSIAITGFSGIIVALDRSEEPWSTLDKVRLSMLLQVSISCVIWSLVPILLHVGDVSADSIWLWSSGLWLGYIGVALGYRLRRLPGFVAQDEDSADSPAWWILALMLAVIALSMVVQAVNVVWLMAPWPHVLTLMLGLLISCVFFVRLLRRVVAPAT